MAIQPSASHPATLLQELAKSKEAQKRQREAEVFILNPQGPVATHTIPKPFDLHDSKNQASQTEHVLSSPTKPAGSYADALGLPCRRSCSNDASS